MINSGVVGEHAQGAQYAVAGLTRIDQLVQDHRELLNHFLDHQNRYHEHLKIIEKEFEAARVGLTGASQDMKMEVAQFESQVSRRIIQLQTQVLKHYEMFRVEQKIRNIGFALLIATMVLLKVL